MDRAELLTALFLWLMSMGSLLIGYLLAPRCPGHEEEVWKPRLPGWHKPEVGTVKQPTAQQQREKGTILGETKKVMEETFAKLL